MNLYLIQTILCQAELLSDDLEFYHFQLLFWSVLSFIFYQSSLQNLIEIVLSKKSMGNICKDDLDSIQIPLQIFEKSYQSSKEVFRVCSSLQKCNSFFYPLEYILKNNLKTWKHNYLQLFYCGKWNQQKAEGIGFCLVPFHYWYEGTFRGGNIDGEGTIFFLKDKVKYTGSFKNGQANGKGSYFKEAKNLVFQGIWANSVPSKGKITFQSSQIKTIAFQLAQLEPNFNEYTRIACYLMEASIQYSNSDFYTGEANQHFKPHGIGSLTYGPDSDMEQYYGKFEEGKFHGEGKFTWKDGSIYEGFYSNGKKQGSGKFTFPNGKVYEGNWLNGKQHGRGILYNSKRKEEKMGIWRNGNLEIKLTKDEYEDI